MHPVINGDSYRFEVITGKPPAIAKSGTKLARGANFRCLLSDSPIKPDYIKAEGIAGRLGQKLMAIVTESSSSRIYIAPTAEMEDIAKQEKPTWRPETNLPDDPRNFWTLNYGLSKFGDLFTVRQLVALNTFSDLVLEAREKIKADALAAGMADDGQSLENGGVGATAYADAVAVYLACGLGRAADYWTSNATWEPGGGFVAHAFTRQAIPMVWDFAEGNPFSNASGNWSQTCIDWIVRVIQLFSPGAQGVVKQNDAQTQSISAGKVVSTDPPYYDNIAYADLSDFFYPWMRRTLRPVYPNLFATMSVPKYEELVATPYRHGGKDSAEAFFLQGMT